MRKITHHPFHCGKTPNDSVLKQAKKTADATKIISSTNSQTAKALKEALLPQLQHAHFTGKPGETRLFYGLNVPSLPSTVAVVGLNHDPKAYAQCEVHAEKQGTRDAMAAAIRQLSDSLSEKRVNVTVDPLAKDAVSSAEAALLSTWALDQYKHEKNHAKTFQFNLVDDVAESMKQDWAKGLILGQGNDSHLSFLFHLHALRNSPLQQYNSSKHGQKTLRNTWQFDDTFLLCRIRFVGAQRGKHGNSCQR